MCGVFASTQRVSKEFVIFHHDQIAAPPVSLGEFSRPDGFALLYLSTALWVTPRIAARDQSPALIGPQQFHRPQAIKRLRYSEGQIVRIVELVIAGVRVQVRLTAHPLVDLVGKVRGVVYNS